MPRGPNPSHPKPLPPVVETARQTGVAEPGEAFAQAPPDVAPEPVRKAARQSRGSASDAIGAFSEEHASKLTGLSLRQLRHWDRIGFFRASVVYDEPRVPYRRIYSFRDLVALRVLNDLRNVQKISIDHLRQVAEEFARLPGDRWTSRTLWVVDKKVVWRNPGIGRREEVVSRQAVLDIPLRIAAASMRARLAELNARGEDKIGKVVRHRFIEHNQPVLAGTRIPVSAIKSFSEAGYDAGRIIKEYPDLTLADVRAALDHEGDSAAA
jgi:uncharacterized protein (DUF433 family)